MRKNKAFTLAEVLITLAVIGVVASLTIPSLIKNTQQTQYHSAFKKFMSDFSQAAKLAADGNGGTLVMPSGADSHTRFRNLFTPYLKTATICDWGNYTTVCWNSNWQYLKSGTPTESYGMNLILTNGMFVSFFNTSIDCSNTAANDALASRIPYCGFVFVDVNGQKSPNTLGKDIYRVVVHKYGEVLPYWIPEYPDQHDCTSAGKGLHCGHFVMQGIDY